MVTADGICISNGCLVPVDVRSLCPAQPRELMELLTLSPGGQVLPASSPAELFSCVYLPGAAAWAGQGTPEPEECCGCAGLCPGWLTGALLSPVQSRFQQRNCVCRGGCQGGRVWLLGWPLDISLWLRIS